MGSALLAAAASVALAVPAIGQPPQATAAPDTPAGDPPAPVAIDGLAPGSHTVTLVTGDRLRLDGAGGRFTVSFEHLAPRPAGQQATTVTVTSVGDTVHAIPGDVADAVAAGRVDRRLFDLGYLAEHDLTDADAATWPLIVRYDRKRAFSTARALPASDATLSLESIDGAALSVPRTGADRFWAAVRGGTPTTLAAGLENVWLDADAELSLDVSVPLVGAPRAWKSGFDGTGVTVAVLDSGADLDHPDLAGQIAESKSFIPGRTVTDEHGHGTHVATTIAGTGAASGGKYRGVAPGAKLMVGRVCELTSCPNSAILEGMEWAASSGADVVSLSLGGDPSDGLDPLSLAVDRLTASSGALFVVAAGNTGPGASTVASPATATSALAVAATTKDDAVAEFSSRGPRLGGGLKPDLAAPGVGIVAGRAAGTSMGAPVDEHYTAADGTSMATPHVSGAAAILAQRHPDWPAERLKAGLMSASAKVDGSVYEVGAGRLDVAKAVLQQVTTTTPSVDLGQTTSGQDTGAVSREVGFANLGDAPVTLRLTRELGRVGGEPVAADRFTGEDTVTVPPGGSATATVALDPAGLADGHYSGAVTATDEASGETLTVPVGMDRQPPRYEVTITVIGSDGEPVCCATPSMMAVDVPNVTTILPQPTGQGTYRASVLAGTYSVTSYLHFTDPVDGRRTVALLVRPEFEVSGPTTVELDVRDAREVTMRTPRPSVPYGQTLTTTRSVWNGLIGTMTQLGGYDFGQYRVLATPTERVRSGLFDLTVSRMLANPQITMTVDGRDGFSLDLLHRGYADRGDRVYGDHWLPWAATNRKVELVDAGFGTPDDLSGKDLRGKLAVLRWGDDRPELDAGGPNGRPNNAIWTDRVQALRDAGAIGYLAVSSPPAGWEDDLASGTPVNTVGIAPNSPDTITLPEAQLDRDQGGKLLDMLARGPVSVRLTVDPNVNYTYQLYMNHSQQVPRSMALTVGQRDLAQVDASYHGAERFVFRSLLGAFTPGQMVSGASTLHSVGPVTRTDYYGPVDGRVVLGRSREPEGALGWNAYTAYPRVERTQERWFTPVTTVGTNDLGDAWAAHDPRAPRPWYLCTMCREGDVLWPLWFESVGSSYVGPPRNGGTRLYREGGEEIALTPIPEGANVPGYRLPEQSGWYRLTHEAPGKRTTWRFHSATPTEDNWMPGAPCVQDYRGQDSTCVQEPVIFLSYDLGRSLRLDNTVSAGGRHEFTVSAKHGTTPSPLPRIAGMRVWTSTDDGATWQGADVDRGRDGEFTVRTSYPRGASATGGVSLKVEAWDSAGNRVEQVLDRAFVLAAR